MKKLIPFKIWIICALGSFFCFFMGMELMNSSLEFSRKINQGAFQIQRIHQADSILSSQKKQLEELNELVKNAQKTKHKIENHLELAAYIDSISLTHDLQTILIPHINLDQEDHSSGNHFEFSLQGNYKNILQAVYQIEYLDRLGFIHQISFEKQKLRTGNEKIEVLSCRILMEKFSFPSLK